MLLSGKLLRKQIRLAFSFYLCDSLNYRGALLPSKTNKTPEWEFLSLCTIITWGQIILEWGCPICCGIFTGLPGIIGCPAATSPRAVTASTDILKYSLRGKSPLVENHGSECLFREWLKTFNGKKKKKNYNWCSLIPSFHGLWRLFPNLSKWKPCFIHRQTNLIQFYSLSASHWMG